MKVRWWSRPDDRYRRFGGGWRWSLGVKLSRRKVVIDLLFGSLVIEWRKHDG